MKKEIRYAEEDKQGIPSRRAEKSVAGITEAAQKRVLCPEEKKMLDGLLFKAIGGKGACEVKRLLEAGADVNAKNERGWTVLMEAADKENVEAFKMLIERGADVNAKTVGLWTALMSACNRHNIEIIRMAIGAGADVNAKDETRQDAIMVAISAKCELPKPVTVIAPILKALVEAGAKVHPEKNAFGFSQLDYARMRARKGNPEIEEIIAAAMATGQAN
ncbi:MAG: ankyrin repeat domain-containing protein [Candidatus Micrarchaeia archaeon]